MVREGKKRRLLEKSALVTGAGGGLGSAIARCLAAEGASVICTDRDQTKVQLTVENICQNGGATKAFTANIEIASDCEAQVEEIVSYYGQIDILVNNAGITLHQLALETSLEDWQRVLNINLTGSFLTAKAAAKHMTKQRSGHIIKIGSISGQLSSMGGIA